MFAGEDASTPQGRTPSARRSKTDELTIPILSIPAGGGASAAKTLSGRSRTNSLSSLPMAPLTGPGGSSATSGGVTNGSIVSPVAALAAPGSKVNNFEWRWGRFALVFSACVGSLSRHRGPPPQGFDTELSYVIIDAVVVVSEPLVRRYLLANRNLNAHGDAFLLCCEFQVMKRKKRLSGGSSAKDLSGGGKWLPEEDERLRAGVEQLGAKNWKRISEEFLDKRRTDVQCLHRWQKVDSS